LASKARGLKKVKSSFYLQKKKELLELIEKTLQKLLVSDDLAKVNGQWLLDEMNRIKKEVETDVLSADKTSLGVFSLRVRDDLIDSDQELWLMVGKVSDEYRKLKRNV